MRLDVVAKRIHIRSGSTTYLLITMRRAILDSFNCGPSKVAVSCAQTGMHAPSRYGR